MCWTTTAGGGREGWRPLLPWTAAGRKETHRGRSGGADYLVKVESTPTMWYLLPLRRFLNVRYHLRPVVRRWASGLTDPCGWSTTGRSSSNLTAARYTNWTENVLTVHLPHTYSSGWGHPHPRLDVRGLRRDDRP